MMKTNLVNVDLFQAKKEMSTRVEEYVKCRVLAKKIKKEYADKISAIQSKLDNLDTWVGSIFEKDIPAQKQAWEDEIADLEEKRDNQLKAEAKFDFTKGDKELKKTLKGLDMSDPKIEQAVISWFGNYDLDVTNSVLLYDIMDAIGGKEDFNKLVDTDGLDAVSVDNSRALSMLYWVAFRHMATVGTIKKAQIPDIIKDNFGKVAKQKKKEAKEAEKKNKKK